MRRILGVLLGFLLLSLASCTRTKEETNFLTRSTPYTTIIKNCHYLLHKALTTIMRTHALFHISHCYNRIRYGSSFTFTPILGGYEAQKSNVLDKDQVSVIFDEQGALISMNDGKKTPLILGNIPSKQDHIDRLKKSINNGFEHTESIGLYTLNEDWECATVGLTPLVNNNNLIIQFLYPSPDFCAPLFIDLLRAVRDLEHRDSYNQHLALVHCKAGRGRSATVVGAYLAHVAQKINISLTAQEIEVYLVSLRPQVKLGPQQKDALTQFISRLKSAGSFEHLYTTYKSAAEQRDQEVMLHKHTYAPYPTLPASAH